MKTDNHKESKASTLIEKAYRKIKQMIFDQRFSPGQRLVYQDLSVQLQMSRTPIINALTRLEEEGFLISEAYRGFSVKPIGPDEAWDLFGVREALEAYAVEQAIRRATSEDLEELKKKLDAHAGLVSSRYTRKKFILDAEFHIQIAASTRNKLLVKNLKTNLEHVYLRFPVNDMDTGRMDIAIEEHEALMKSIMAKNILGAVAMVRDHIERARDNLMSCLSSNESEVLFDSVFPR